MVEIIEYDFRSILAHALGGEAEHWEEMDGPDSGSGLDYWYQDTETGDEVYINLDQTILLVSCDEREFSEEFDLENLGEDQAWIEEHIVKAATTAP